jgi:hypothetical protein
LFAARDTIAFLRHGGAEDGNPCAGEIRHAYAFGASQSGRYLRQFLYLGLNEDEAERMVFDGMLVHIAGGKRGGDFNQRFGQPSVSLHPTMSNAFPFNGHGEHRPGHRTQRRPARPGVAPIRPSHGVSRCRRPSRKRPPLALTLFMPREIDTEDTNSTPI